MSAWKVWVWAGLPHSSRVLWNIPESGAVMCHKYLAHICVDLLFVGKSNLTFLMAHTFYQNGMLYLTAVLGWQDKGKGLPQQVTLELGQ